MTNVPTSKVDLVTARTMTVHDVALSTTTSSRGAVASLDDTDIRLVTQSRRWEMGTAWEIDPIDRTGLLPLASSSSSQDKASATAAAAATTKRQVGFLREWSRPLSCDEEAVTRDVHAAKSSRMVGAPDVAMDLECGRLVSKEGNKKNQPFYCRGTELYRINLIGVAVRPKGPKVPPGGPFYTFCATCGATTIYSDGCCNARGPSCGAHGRPHRLPPLLSAPFDPEHASRTDMDRLRADLMHAAAAPGETGSVALAAADEVIRSHGRAVSRQLQSDLSVISAAAGFPAPDNIPQCWYCHTPADQRPPCVASSSSSSGSGSSELGAMEAVAKETEDRWVDLLSNKEACLWDRVHAAAPAVRMCRGKSVASAPMSSTGAAIHARITVTRGTDQTPPVRRINIRAAMFESDGVGGTLGDPLAPGDPHPDWPPPDRCARQDCDCLSRAFAVSTNDDDDDDGDSAAAARRAAETFNRIGSVTRRHARILTAPVLPIELLPAPGPEMYFKVLDDTTAPVIRQRCIYLCNVHSKDRRMGWISRHGRTEQIAAEHAAACHLAEGGVCDCTGEDRTRIGHVGNLSSWSSSTLSAASECRHIGRGAMVQRMFARVPLLSDVRRDISVGSDRRFSDAQIVGSIPGSTGIPDVSANRRRNHDGATYVTRKKVRWTSLRGKHRGGGGGGGHHHTSNTPQQQQQQQQQQKKVGAGVTGSRSGSRSGSTQKRHKRLRQILRENKRKHKAAAPKSTSLSSAQKRP